MYVFGNSENAGFAFELNFTGGVGGELDLPGFRAEASHHIPDRYPLVKPGKHESSIGGIFPDPKRKISSWGANGDLSCISAAAAFSASLNVGPGTRGWRRPRPRPARTCAPG